VSCKNMNLVAEIIRDAGGRIVGRTRLQKTAYFLAVTGCGEDFGFRYKHFGPYCEEVARAAEVGVLFDKISEEEKEATWGGTYSIYTVDAPMPDNVPVTRRKVAHLCANTGAIALELAATAVFLSRDGCENPWQETERRKPQKAQDHLREAQTLLAMMRKINLPTPLPHFS